MVRSTPDPIRTSSEWVQQLLHTTTRLMQDGKKDEASRNQTTTRKVDNKNENFLNSAPKYRNWSQPSKDWFPRSQTKAIMEIPKEGIMDHEQVPHLVDNTIRPKNDIFGVHYCVG